MNLGKRDGLDALLKDWPSPTSAFGSTGDDDAAWEARAEKVSKAALSGEAKEIPAATFDALVEAPSLPAEPGEPGTMTMGETPRPPVARGETPSISPASVERKRMSLKEMAAAAKAGSGPASMRPASTDRASIAPSGDRASSPGRISSPPASVKPSTATPLPGAARSSASGARPVEAGKEDSGVINLRAVRDGATAAQVAAAERAKPGQASLYDDAVPASGVEDERTAESAVNPSEKIPHARVPNIAIVGPKKESRSAYVGIAIAVIGIAAAFAIVARKPPPPARTDVPATPTPVKVAEAPKPALEPARTAVAAATTAPAADPSSLPEATGSDSKPSDGPKRVALGGPLPPAATTTAAPKDDPAKTAAAVPTGKPGDLQSEMAKAVGPIDKSNQDTPAPEPAAAGPRNQNIPEQPSQGSVQAAIGVVMGGAKGCVSGADDVTRANITFNSAGGVSSVSVSGWAASHGQSGCVQGALKAAKVGPFSKASYSVGVNIRP